MIRIDILKDLREDLDQMTLVEGIQRMWTRIKPTDVITPEYIGDLVKYGGAKDTGRPHKNAKAGKLKFPFYYEDSMRELHANGDEYPAPYEHLSQLDYEKASQHSDYPKVITQLSLTHFGWAREKMNKTIQLKSGMIRAWRQISVPEATLAKLVAGGSLGIFWTFDDDSYSGQGFWMPTGKNLLAVHMEALIPQTSVDWIQTYVQNMDWFHGMSECELRLRIGAPLRLVSCTANDKKVKLPAGSWVA